MLSLKKLLGHDEKFYDLLEASAQQADSSVHHLVALLAKLEQHESPQSLEEFVHSRRKDKKITQELTEQLCKTFTTPLELEDIKALEAAPYHVPQKGEKINKRIRICPNSLNARHFAQHLKITHQDQHALLALSAGRGVAADLPVAMHRLDRALGQDRTAQAEAARHHCHAGGRSASADAARRQPRTQAAAVFRPPPVAASR